jgi:glycosyltransferase involved in cell wall biosynthesis
MIAIVADRWDAAAAGGGRELYAQALIAHLRAGGATVVTLQPGDRVPPGASAVLALTPSAGATHYQLHSGLLEAAFRGERVALQSRVRRTLYATALALNRRRQQLLAAESTILNGAAALMVFSNADAARLAARAVDSSRVLVRRPGIDLRRFHPRESLVAQQSGPRAIRLLFVAHNTILKGLATAVLAVGRARQRGVDATLTVVGRGFGPRDRRAIERAGLTTAVAAEGTASPDRLADLYRAADALIHPAFYDPFPRVCVESLASGCPVITTRCCGAAEIVRDGCEGFVIDDPHDIDGFVDAIEAVVTGPRSPMRQAAAALGQRFDELAHFGEVVEWLRHSSADPL